MITEASGGDGRFQVLHTMVRVKDLDRSLDFYTRLLGMKLLRKQDYRAASSPSPSSATGPRRPTR